MKFIKKYYKQAILLVLGNFIYAFGVVAFIEPKGLITGGVTGLSLFVTYLVPKLPLWLMILIFNSIFFLIGLFTLGKRFALSTLASSLINPLCVMILSYIPMDVFNFEELFASIISGALLIGLGLGMVLKTGASTGGVDIIAILLHNKFKRLSIGTMLTAIDILIISLQIFRGSVETLVYGIFMALIYTVTLDKIMMVGNSKVSVSIVSMRYKKLRKALIEDLDLGLTMLNGETGYLEVEFQEIVTIIDYRNLNHLIAKIDSIDKNAFIYINKVSEVRGQGFTRDRIPVNK